MAKTATKTKESDAFPEGMLFAKDCRELAYVPEDSTYYVTIQLGASTRWRNYGPGRWVRDREAERDAEVDPATGKPKPCWRHLPNIVRRSGPWSSSITNGLIGEHNRWVQLNAGRSTGGEVQRQLLVLATEETADLALDTASQRNSLHTILGKIAAGLERQSAAIEQLVAGRK